jgi:hypothetical protein
LARAARMMIVDEQHAIADADDHVGARVYQERRHR